MGNGFPYICEKGYFPLACFCCTWGWFQGWLHRSVKVLNKKNISDKVANTSEIKLGKLLTNRHWVCFIWYWALINAAEVGEAVIQSNKKSLWLLLSRSRLKGLLMLLTRLLHSGLGISLFFLLKSVPEGSGAHCQQAQLGFVCFICGTGALWRCQSVFMFNVPSSKLCSFQWKLFTCCCVLYAKKV